MARSRIAVLCLVAFMLTGLTAVAPVMADVWRLREGSPTEALLQGLGGARTAPDRALAVNDRAVWLSIWSIGLPVEEVVVQLSQRRTALYASYDTPDGEGGSTMRDMTMRDADGSFTFFVGQPLAAPSVQPAPGALDRYPGRYRTVTIRRRPDGASEVTVSDVAAPGTASMVDFGVDAGTGGNGADWIGGLAERGAEAVMRTAQPHEGGTRRVAVYRSLTPVAMDGGKRAILQAKGFWPLSLSRSAAGTMWSAGNGAERIAIFTYAAAPDRHMQVIHYDVPAGAALPRATQKGG